MMYAYMTRGARTFNEEVCGVGKNAAYRTPVRGMFSVVLLGWAVMSGINNVFGGFFPLLTNQPDLARYCRMSFDASWPQGVGMFVAHTLVFFMGMAGTASIQRA